MLILAEWVEGWMMGRGDDTVEWPQYANREKGTREEMRHVCPGGSHFSSPEQQRQKDTAWLTHSSDSA